MKQTVLNFNQQAILELSKMDEEGKIIKLDATDLLILDWFIYFTPKMQSINCNGKIYYWLSYNKLQEDLPFLDFKKRTFTDKLRKLCELDILSFYLNKEQGNTTFYGFGDNYFKLIEETNRCATNVGVCSENCKGYVVETAKGMQKKPQTYSSIIDSSNNIYNNIFNHWNTKGIIKHNSLNTEMKKYIDKRLKDYTMEIIKLAIDHYAEAYHSSYEYCDYKWNLETFLKQDNAFKDFLDDGSKWNNYLSWKSKNKNPYSSKPEISKETSYPDYKDKNYL